MGLFKTIFKSYSEKELKKAAPLQQKVLDLEPVYVAMSDAELSAQTDILKERIPQNAEPDIVNKILDEILPEAFAVCREAAWRVLGMKHFPVQVLGGIILHQGRIAEMKTGEGKTLVETLPAYLNALTGQGVHIVTVNDYLAKRDSEWMGKVYRFLGLSVGLIVNGLNKTERRAAYNADITYGTNNEMGFDYLRDNMVSYKEDRVQRGHVYAIVDEVDSILIDEARTPLIISGAGEKSTDLYAKADKFARTLSMVKVTEMKSGKSDGLSLSSLTDPGGEDEISDDEKGDYIVDEKARTATLTPLGVEKAEKYFKVENLMDVENNELLHHITQAIKAHGVMARDVNYVVQNDEVIIVDEFTGRLMIGRRYNEGLHQAIEAKEGVTVERETRTLATITFQNYFRLYRKLAGMTGTALTEQEEFREIYNLDCIEIPTNKPLIRNDRPDVLYKTENGKFNAIAERVQECHAKNQPILVGTVSIEKSEQLSRLLRKKGVKHEVLNAKEHAREADIIAQAGKPGAVTIATNMAGRGTDITLGGNAEYMAKEEMRRRGYDGRIINEADSFAKPDIMAGDMALEETYAYFYNIDTDGDSGAIFGNLRRLDIRHLGFEKFVFGEAKNLNPENFSEILAHASVNKYAQELAVQRRDPSTRVKAGIKGEDRKKNIDPSKYYKKLAALYKEKLSGVQAVYAASVEEHHSDIIKAKEIYTQLTKEYREKIVPEADKVREAGGLFILGTERHESRRIDNQLRGRSGRQGDPGESQFFLSPEDDLLRLYNGERLRAALDAFNAEEDMAIESKMLSRIIESAQKQVEGRNFSIRKNVLQFDDVMNRQRELIYKERNQVLDGEDMRGEISKMIDENISETVGIYINDEAVHDDWNLAGLRDYYLGWLTAPDDFQYSPRELQRVQKKDLVRALTERAHQIYELKEKECGPALKELQEIAPPSEVRYFPKDMRDLERRTLLNCVDGRWMNHIDAMDELKNGMGLRSYGQHDPVVEYRREGSEMFDEMVYSIKEDTVKELLTLEPMVLKKRIEYIKKQQSARVDIALPKTQQSKTVKKGGKLGRNDPCWCGSGKKYKKCHYPQEAPSRK
jgi:preprotein translocase SecA subunit